MCYLGVLISFSLFQLFYVQGVLKAVLCCLTCKGFHGRSREVRICLVRRRDLFMRTSLSLLCFVVL